MLFTGACDVCILGGRLPPELFLGRFAPGLELDSDFPSPANEGCCCCCCCGWLVGVGCCSRGRPGDIPPGAGTLVGDWLFWIWLEMNEKLLMLPQLLLLARTLFGKLAIPWALFVLVWTVTYCLKCAELDCELLLPPLLSPLMSPAASGGWFRPVSRASTSPSTPQTLNKLNCVYLTDFFKLLRTFFCNLTQNSEFIKSYKKSTLVMINNKIQWLIK